MNYIKRNRTKAVADPGFPRGVADLLFGISFAKNCMKIERIGLRKGMRVSGLCPGSATEDKNHGIALQTISDQLAPKLPTRLYCN